MNSYKKKWKIALIKVNLNLLLDEQKMKASSIRSPLYNRISLN